MIVLNNDTSLHRSGLLEKIPKEKDLLLRCGSGEKWKKETTKEKTLKKRKKSLQAIPVKRKLTTNKYNNRVGIAKEAAINASKIAIPEFKVVTLDIKPENVDSQQSGDCFIFHFVFIMSVYVYRCN